MKNLENMKLANFIRIKHLKDLPIEEWDKEFEEHIIFDHDMQAITFRLNQGNQKAMANAMCEIAKKLVN
jgi:hypothetical protein